MENRIHSILNGPTGTVLVDIFAYTSNGLPGLEIIGLGTCARAIKEKFIYLSKIRRLKIPMRRYVLCVEPRRMSRPVSAVESLYLECPLLLCYWSLAHQLHIPRLEDCLSVGQVSVMGHIHHLELSQATQKKVKEDIQSHGPTTIKWITQENAAVLEEDIFLLPAHEVFNSISLLQHELLPEKIA